MASKRAGSRGTLAQWFGVNSTPTAEEANTANENEPQDEHTHTTESTPTASVSLLCETGEITDTAPTDTAENFAAVLAADRLKLLRSAAADFDRLTQVGEHIAAVNARLSALFACGVDVADLVQCADYKADQRARQRAAAVLTADEFRTLYGFGREQPEDGGGVWQSMPTAKQLRLSPASVLVCER